jgi:predicted AlkP superfamily pyrophosphatase or phosphodiesterase
MRPRFIRSLNSLVVALCLAASPIAAASSGSAYSGHPKLVVIIIIDQFRGDYLERYRADFIPGGFNLFLEHGAVFANCQYDYASTRTAPGHATLLTGAYADGHGILSNDYWDPERALVKDAKGDSCGKVPFVWDKEQRLVWLSATSKRPEESVCTPGSASPHNLQADTFGDELKQATQGGSRVYAVSLKERAAVFSGGFSANGAFWPDSATGAWTTSTYYYADSSKAPAWIQAFNDRGCGGPCAAKLREQAKAEFVALPPATKQAMFKPEDFDKKSFYDATGFTTAANQYELDFAEQLLQNEQLGQRPEGTTDLLIVSLSANDILGHKVGPDDPAMKHMALELDRQLSGFFADLGSRIGLAQTVLVLSADHGMAPAPEVAKKRGLPAAGYRSDCNESDQDKTGCLREELNAALENTLAKRIAAAPRTGEDARASTVHRDGRPQFVVALDYPLAWLGQPAFQRLGMNEAEAEQAVGNAMMSLKMEQPFRGFYTRAQLAKGEVPPNETGRRYLHSYAPAKTWYVFGVPAPYTVDGTRGGADHTSPYTYDTHVPLAFYGVAFRPGVYRGHAEPVDLAPTLASILGINPPSSSIGRVLTEALQPTGERP